jgi:predicted RNase H-like HicB family nuclease
MKVKSIILTKSGTGWDAHSPDAAVIATGKTAKKALKEFKAAAEFHFEGLAQDEERAA